MIITKYDYRLETRNTNIFILFRVSPYRLFVFSTKKKKLKSKMISRLCSANCLRLLLVFYTPKYFVRSAAERFAEFSSSHFQYNSNKLFTITTSSQIIIIR